MTTEGHLCTVIVRLWLSPGKLTNITSILKAAEDYEMNSGSGAEHIHWSYVIRIRLVDYLPFTNKNLTDSQWHPVDSNIHSVGGCLKPFRESQLMFHRSSAHVLHQAFNIVHTFNSQGDCTIGVA